MYIPTYVPKTAACAFLTLIATALLWRDPVALVLVLIAVSASIIAIDLGKNTYIIYGAGFILGPLCETVMIYSGAWTYAEPHILGFPVWLPFVWGNAAVTLSRVSRYSNYLKTGIVD